MIETGIGTDLYSTDVKENTELLDLYLRHMCVQGGLGHFDGDKNPVCDTNYSDPVSWTIVVRAGFNDIDRRCDAYLAWLNSKRRTNRAVLNQLSQTATATQSIMRIASASADAITIVGLAFGLARDSFTNYYSRLLLEVESSTVELVVIENRQNFRTAVNEAPILFQPDAVHILRSYLLICTPHIIENNINVRTQFSVAGNILPPQDLSGARVRSSLTSTALLRSLPKDPRSALPPQDGKGPPPDIFISGAVTQDESVITRPEGIRIQQNLCVAPALGNFAAKTRAAIVLAKEAAPNIFLGDRSNTLNNDVQISAVLKQASCIDHPTKYLNAYEKFKLHDEQSVKNFQLKLAQCDEKAGRISTPEYKTPVTQSGIFDENTRNAISTLKSRLIDNGTLTEEKSNQLFQQSYNSIVMCIGI